MGVVSFLKISPPLSYLFLLVQSPLVYSVHSCCRLDLWIPEQADYHRRGVNPPHPNRYFSSSLFSDWSWADKCEHLPRWQKGMGLAGWLGADSPAGELL